MDLTKDEILQKMRDDMPFRIGEMCLPYIKEAMDIYAEQESRAFAHWLSYQVIAGRTMDKLRKDYHAELREE